MLTKLWHEVEPNTANIKALFPEYTPHDVTHLCRLFELTERILKKPLLIKLNATETFLLSAAIIGHDWGMGVETAEADAILGIRDQDINKKGKKIHLLNNEFARFQKYQNAHGKITWNQPTSCFSTTIELDRWRNYIRETHPERSAIRIRAHFNDQGEDFLGDAIALICWGHGRDRADIEFDNQYSNSLPLNGEVVNLTALTLYLRLIDLIDVGRGRTPYELWQFVNPRDQRSAAEWKRHRATEEPVIKDKIIQFRAATADPSILADIYNLKKYCDDEISWQTSILDSTPIHSRNRYHHSGSHWTVEPKEGLYKSPVKFELSRPDLLRLLSEEIYDGDPYVFLRELIQNSIDATTVRQKFLATSGQSVDANKAGIFITSFEKDGINYVSVKDDGSGMTAYVIKEYLSVIGKSYYGSKDFHELNIQVDPISKYGIGILSCFVIAESLTIRTRPSPECHKEGVAIASEAWEIKIRSGQNGLPTGHWEWHQIRPETLEVGTEVLVTIDEIKLETQMRRLKQGHQSKRLQVTTYLKAIIGFPKYPIYIDEYGQKTAIFHPKSPPPSLKYTPHKLATSYDFQCHVRPTCLHEAKSLFSTINEDIAIPSRPEIEGTLSYPKPNESWNVDEISAHHLSVSDPSGAHREISGPRTSRGNYMGFLEDTSATGICKSAMRFARGAVYSNGILVPNYDLKNLGIHSPYSGLLATPNLFINITNTANDALILEPSRLNFKDTGDSLVDFVMRHRSQEIGKALYASIKTKNPRERFFEIFRVVRYDFIHLESMLLGIPTQELPLPVIKKGGRIDYHTIQELSQNEELIEAPRAIADIAIKNIFSDLKGINEPAVSIPSWQAPMCVLGILNFPKWSGMIQYPELLLRSTYGSKSNVLLSGPFLKTNQDTIPLPAFKVGAWTRNTHISWRKIDPIPLLKKYNDKVLNLSKEELLAITHIFPNSLTFDFQDSKIPRPFAQYCFWGTGEININHPIGNSLFRLFIKCTEARINGKLSTQDQDKAEGLFLHVPIKAFTTHEPDRCLNSLADVQTWLSSIYTFSQECSALNLNIPITPKITFDDFLPSAFHFQDKDRFLAFSLDGNLFNEEILLANITNNPFGHLLNENSQASPTQGRRID